MYVDYYNLIRGNMEEEKGTSSFRPKMRRESAEIAKKKVKLGFCGGNSTVASTVTSVKRKISTDDSSSNSGSREGSCDRNNCTASDKFCTLELSLSCINTIGRFCGARTPTPSRNESPIGDELENFSNGNITNARSFYHISASEHYCQACHDEISKPGRSWSEGFTMWKSKWTGASRQMPSLRLFVSNELLPYWCQCIECGKWRPLPRSQCYLTSQIISVFTCQSLLHSSDADCKPCQISQHTAVVEAITQREWVESLHVPPLLQNSPSIYYLAEEYYHDEIGMCPLHSTFQFEKNNASTEVDFVQPFNLPLEGVTAQCLRPDVMEYDEIVSFPEYHAEPVLYLALRNLIVALWHLNLSDNLTLEKCSPYVICRGMARIWLVTELKRVLQFLTLKGVINFGILPPLVKPIIESRNNKKMEVVIVGAGIAGICAGRQLKAFGAAKVQILEAKGKIGGRMQDDWSLGVAVGCGAQLVTGIVNNPIIIMCHQAGIAYRSVTENCPLLDSETGRLIDLTNDRRVDEHFNCMLDALQEWRTRKPLLPDSSLQAQLTRIHEMFIQMSKLRWTPEEDRLLNWQMGNVEFSCGAQLNDVSAKQWDQNEAMPQFAGQHALLTEGSSDILHKLVDGLDIRCNHKVDTIDWRSGRKKIIIHCANGKRYTADKVLIAVPLAVLQLGGIRFNPELPENKRVSLKKLGSGLIEKVAVRFSRRFWSKLVSSDGTVDYFGHVPKTESERGLFNMFYDFSSRNKTGRNQSYVLMSYICGESAHLVNEKSDVEIVELFIDTLRSLFPDEDIPDADGYVVTHWARDPHIGMSYSYIRVGSSGDDYDALAEQVHNKLYFAGECTNRYFPQTMTGAFLSGLREAGKMMKSWDE